VLGGPFGGTVRSPLMLVHSWTLARLSEVRVTLLSHTEAAFTAVHITRKATRSMGCPTP
jgi:hypothetical protein